MTYQDEDMGWAVTPLKVISMDEFKELYPVIKKVTSKEYQDSVADKNAEHLLKTPRYEA